MDSILAAMCALKKRGVTPDRLEVPTVEMFRDIFMSPLLAGSEVFGLRVEIDRELSSPRVGGYAGKVGRLEVRAREWETVQ